MSFVTAVSLSTVARPSLNFLTIVQGGQKFFRNFYQVFWISYRFSKLQVFELRKKTFILNPWWFKRLSYDWIKKLCVNLKWINSLQNNKTVFYFCNNIFFQLEQVNIRSYYSVQGCHWLLFKFVPGFPNFFKVLKSAHFWVYF